MSKNWARGGLREYPSRRKVCAIRGGAGREANWSSGKRAWCKLRPPQGRGRGHLALSMESAARRRAGHSGEVAVAGKKGGVSGVEIFLSPRGGHASFWHMWWGRGEGTGPVKMPLGFVVWETAVHA